jgi:Mn-dependent transcriptional regulator
MSSRESYIRAIYRLTDAGDSKTKTSKVSEELGVSNASASEAIQKLQEDNLVCRVAYKGFTLSPMGKEECRKAEKKFEKLEKIFEKTGVEEPRREADAIEHSVSRDTVWKLEEEVLKN